MTVPDAPEREWKPGVVVFMCSVDPDRPLPPEPSEACDCGYVGQWDHRPWFAWHDETAKERKARERAGHAAKPGNGQWFMAGWEERCPGCGDIERFNVGGEMIERRQEKARVLVFMDAYRAKG
jgi:hypothetical protein